MEKIQEAIAKARALRDAQDVAGAPREVTQRAGTDAGSDRPDASAASFPAADPPSRSGPRIDEQQPDPNASRTVDSLWQAAPEHVPGASVLRRHRIMTATGGKEAIDFDAIRTRILQMQRVNGWRRIAVTSPGPGCGKSTLVLNLAFSLARQPDQRTIVAEMDLRRPAIARMTGARQKHQFAAVLRGRDSFENNAFRAAPNLLIATNHDPVKDSAELLQGESAATALDDIAARYRPTIMLFDLPPLMAVDDTIGFLARVDAVILVAAAEQTSIKQVDLCEREIAAQTNVMGVVLNKCRYMDREQSYDYGY